MYRTGGVGWGDGGGSHRDWTCGGGGCEGVGEAVVVDIVGCDLIGDEDFVDEDLSCATIDAVEQEFQIAIGGGGRHG